MTDQTITTDATDDDDEKRRRGLLWMWLAVVTVLLAGLLAAIDRYDGCSGTCGGKISGGSTLAGGGTAAPGNESQSAQSISPLGAGAAPASIRVSGSERGGLAPGMTSPVVIAITNTGHGPARITSARVVVGDASPTCTAADSIRVTHYDFSDPGAHHYDLAPGSAVRIPLTLSMLDLTTNQNACKNARFPLTFQATAQQG
ncbi:MAG TPA: hypothetical protein VHV76_12220 [Mycobacteriales bacterium]|jgi:hypothetical protein|nr:hypothetical protein [Mycobacteriales bacterium]